MPVDSRALIALLSRGQDPRLAFLPPQLQSLMAMRGGIGDPRLAQPSVGRPMGLQPAPQNFPPSPVAPMPQPAVPMLQGRTPQQQGGLLNRLFLGGIPAGLLSPQDEKAALQQGLLNAGLGLLAASGRRAQPFNFGEALLQALALGQGAAQQTAAGRFEARQAQQQAQEEKRLQAQRDAIFADDPGKPGETLDELEARMERYLPKLARIGDSKTVGQFVQLLQTRQQTGLMEVAPGGRVIERRSGREVYAAPGKPNLPEWEEAGFPTEQAYISYKGRLAAAMRAPKTSPAGERPPNKQRWIAEEAERLSKETVRSISGQTQKIYPTYENAREEAVRRYELNFGGGGTSRLQNRGDFRPSLESAQATLNAFGGTTRATGGLTPQITTTPRPSVARTAGAPTDLERQYQEILAEIDASDIADEEKAGLRKEAEERYRAAKRRR